MHLTYQNKHTIKQFQLLPFSVKHVLKNWERNSFDELNLFQFECHPTPINRRHLERRRGRRRKRKKEKLQRVPKAKSQIPKIESYTRKNSKKKSNIKGRRNNLIYSKLSKARRNPSPCLKLAHVDYGGFSSLVSRKRMKNREERIMDF